MDNHFNFTYNLVGYFNQDKNMNKENDNDFCYMP